MKEPSFDSPGFAMHNAKHLMHDADVPPYLQTSLGVEGTQYCLGGRDLCVAENVSILGK